MGDEGALNDVRPALDGRGPNLISDVTDFIADGVEVSVREGLRWGLTDLRSRPRAV